MHPSATQRHTDAGAAAPWLLIAVAAIAVLIAGGFILALGAAAGPAGAACDRGAAAGAPNARPAPRADADIPADYLEIYRRAGLRYGISWALLAGIGKVESDHGRARLPGVHSGQNYAGASGPMQFLASTWHAYGVDGDRDGDIDPYAPADAIPAAARYLRASGAPRDVRKALWSYNHSTLYYQRVIGWASRYAAGGYTAVDAGTAGCPAPGKITGGPLGGRIVAYARRYLGWPYQWGGGDEHGPTRGSAAHGTSHLGWDCSGLTKYAVYQATGGRVNLNHLAADQYRDSRLRHVGYRQLQPGDLVFFHPDLSHVGIYVGNGQMIHAPRTGQNVEIAEMSTGYYSDNFVGAARVPDRR